MQESFKNLEESYGVTVYFKREGEEYEYKHLSAFAFTQMLADDLSTETVSTNDFTKEIEDLYKKEYPRKDGKSKGVKLLAKVIKTKSDLEKLRLAILEYKKRVIEEEREMKYVKIFSSFAAEWEDFVPEVSEPKKRVFFT